MGTSFEVLALIKILQRAIPAQGSPQQGFRRINPHPNLEALYEKSLSWSHNVPLFPPPQSFRRSPLLLVGQIQEIAMSQR